jgi:hypothetical protein
VRPPCNDGTRVRAQPSHEQRTWSAASGTVYSSSDAAVAKLNGSAKHTATHHSRPMGPLDRGCDSIFHSRPRQPPAHSPHSRAVCSTAARPEARLSLHTRLPRSAGVGSMLDGDLSELLDEVDDANQLTGRTVQRKLAHEQVGQHEHETLPRRGGGLIGDARCRESRTARCM